MCNNYIITVSDFNSTIQDVYGCVTFGKLYLTVNNTFESDSTNVMKFESEDLAKKQIKKYNIKYASVETIGNKYKINNNEDEVNEMVHMVHELDIHLH